MRSGVHEVKASPLSQTPPHTPAQPPRRARHLLLVKAKSAKSQATLNWDFSCFSSAIIVAVVVVAAASRYCRS